METIIDIDSCTSKVITIYLLFIQKLDCDCLLLFYELLADRLTIIVDMVLILLIEGYVYGNGCLLRFYADCLCTHSGLGWSVMHMCCMLYLDILITTAWRVDWAMVLMLAYSDCFHYSH